MDKTYTEDCGWGVVRFVPRLRFIYRNTGEETTTEMVEVAGIGPYPRHVFYFHGGKIWRQTAIKGGWVEIAEVTKPELLEKAKAWRAWFCQRRYGK